MYTKANLAALRVKKDIAEAALFFYKVPSSALMYTGYLYLSLIKTVLVYGYSEGAYREEDDLEPQQGNFNSGLLVAAEWHFDRRNILRSLELSRQRLNATHASTSIDFPDGTRNLLKLKVGVSMTAGLYEGATFYFLLTIPPSYPFHAPSVVCTSRAWHPNIDLHTGFVSLPILTTDWRPVLSINTVVFALQLMFLEPSEQMPVNESAAAALANPELFREQVRSTLAGGFLFGVQFEPHRQGSGWGRDGGSGAAQKRKRGEGMDTEAVQTTLEAMHIQDADVEKSSWDKRPRQHRRQEQAQSSPDPGCGAPLSSNQSYVGASFDRPRFPDVQAEMSVASPVGFRCSVVQSGVAQPTKNGIADGTTGGWGGGQFQAVPASSLQ